MKECLEKGVRLSESALWRLQSEAYGAFGPQSWIERGVPYQMTSNALIAQQYAEVALAELAERGELCVLELGGGSGKFAYLFLQEVMGRAKGKVRYVLTDAAAKNVAYWAQHPLLKGVEREVYDPLERRWRGAERVFVIANYFFDTIVQELYRVEGGQLYEGRISLEREGRGLEGLRESVEYVPIARADDPDCPEVAALMERYLRELSCATVLMPLGAMRTLENLPSYVMLAGDKGFSTLAQLAAVQHHHLFYHGTFSFPVNFHALGRYVTGRGGVALQPKAPHPTFSVHLLASEAGPQVRAAYERVFAVDVREVCERFEAGQASLEELNWDASFALRALQRGESVPLERVKGSFFPLCQEEALLFYNLGGTGDFMGLPKRERGEVLVIGEGPATGKRIGLTLDFEGVYDEIYFFAPEQVIAEKKSPHSLVNEGKKLVREIEQMLPALKDIKYTDADLDVFLQSVDRSGLFEVDQLREFFTQLVKQGAIEPAQFERVCKKEGWPAFDEATFFYELVMRCAKSHMRSGSVLRARLFDTTSKYEDARVLRDVIENPYLDFKEEERVEAGRKVLWVTVSRF